MLQIVCYEHYSVKGVPNPSENPLTNCLLLIVKLGIVSLYPDKRIIVNAAPEDPPPVKTTVATKPNN
jgi:hypothetical protein